MQSLDYDAPMKIMKAAPNAVAVLGDTADPDDDDGGGMSLMILMTMTWKGAVPKVKCSHSSGFRGSRRTACFPAGKFSGGLRVPTS